MPVAERDLRLDFFRGVALVLIFINHIPENPLGKITPRNFGFSDAAELFIFLSGYSAGLVYGGLVQRQGVLFAGLRVTRRIWQLYVAHILLLFIFAAQVAYSSGAFANLSYWDEMAIAAFFNDTPVAMPQALILLFQPAFMNILPMYIVLLLMLLPALPLLRRSRPAVLALSFALYLTVCLTGINLPAYPAGVWYFNPLAWQMLFAVGLVLGWAPEQTAAWLPRARPFVFAAAAFLLFSLILTLSWRMPLAAALVPDWLRAFVYPISKTDLSPWRAIHILALAYIVVRYVPRGSPLFVARLARPLVVCGRNGLEVFCAGIILSYVGRVIVTEYSHDSVTMIAVNLAGLAAMIGFAYALSWFRGNSRRLAGAAAQSA